MVRRPNQASCGSGLLVGVPSWQRKAGSRDSLETLQTLASCAEEARAVYAPGVPAAAQQAAFGVERVSSCGCLGGCGSGPNCVDERDGSVYYDVYKPGSAATLLEHVEGLHVPEPATKAWLKRMYAMRSLRQNKPAEALGLVGMALNEAGVLKQRGAHMLSGLLELRADIHEQQQSAEAAAADRKHAQQMREVMLPESEPVLLSN